MHVSLYVFPLYVNAAVITAVPFARVSTSPSATVATFTSDDDHVTVTFAGSVVTSRIQLSFNSIFTVSAFRAIAGVFTVTLNDSEKPPYETVTVLLPAEDESNSLKEKPVFIYSVFPLLYVSFN